MVLEEYRRKRDFSKTTEPSGAATDQNPQKKAYVIQKHQASHLHYDLRLEFDGVLKSWAIPKEPPLEEGIKRLAVQTEDHPLDYASFEGRIPEGEYGAGVVEIWDNGTFEVVEGKKGALVIKIMGNKLEGTYVLVQTKQAGGRNWIFFKKNTPSILAK